MPVDLGRTMVFIPRPLSLIETFEEHNADRQTAKEIGHLIYLGGLRIRRQTVAQESPWLWQHFKNRATVVLER